MQYKLHSGQCDVYLIFKHLIYVSFLESHLCRIRYHMRRMSHLLIAINTASASICRAGGAGCVEPCQRMRPVTLHPYVARRAPPKSVPTVQVDVHVVPGHMHTPCLHGVEGAAAVVAREGGSSAAGHRVVKPL